MPRSQTSVWRLHDHACVAAPYTSFTLKTYNLLLTQLSNSFVCVCKFRVTCLKSWLPSGIIIWSSANNKECLHHSSIGMPIFRHYFFILAVIAYIPYVLNKVGDRRHPSINRYLRNTIRLYSMVQSSVVQSFIFVGLRSRSAVGIGRGHSVYEHRGRWSIRILIMMMMVTRKKLNYILKNAVYRYHWEEIIHSLPPAVK